MTGRREAASCRRLSLAPLFVALFLAAPAPLWAQIPFDVLGNALGFELRQTLTKQDARFGRIVATDGRLILAAGDGGGFYTYIRTPGGFVETHSLYEGSPLAGRALALHNGRAIVGFEYGAGIFRYTDAGWELERYVVGGQPAFGVAVDITDDYAIVGGAQTVQILRREGVTWLDDAEFHEPPGSGTSVRVAISGQRAITHVTAPGSGPGSFGPLRVYGRSAAGWSETAVSTHGIQGDLDLDGERLIASPSTELSGNVRIYDVDQPTLTFTGTLPNTPPVTSVTVSGNRVGVSFQSSSRFAAGGAMIGDPDALVALFSQVGPPARPLPTLFNVRVTQTDAGGVFRPVGQASLAGDLLVLGVATFDGEPGALTIFEVQEDANATPSPSGTRTPPAPQVVDSNLDVWTLSSGLETLRNGVHAGGGLGSQYLWYQNVLYVLGLDEQWWRWAGDGWYPHGPSDPAGDGGGLAPSPSGTRTPPAPQVVDSTQAVWTLSSGLETLRNGAHAGGGFGTQLLWYRSVLYVLGLDGEWWRWTGAGWYPHGPTDPSSSGSGPLPSPNGARGTSITDNNLAVWTLGPSFQTLRNGAHSGFGFGTEYLWRVGILYVLGTDGNWYMWTGSSWTFFGPDPAS